MELTDIDTLSQIAAGEYLYHQPSGQIAVCGQIRSGNDKIKVLMHGRIFEDKMTNFQKIQLSTEEHRARHSTGCGSCKGG
jgi:hypothetical protein